jgi:Spy/CpxP family protein refolding chaperone
MKLPISILGAALLAASTAVYAQAPQGQKGERPRFDCSKAKDPKLCEERREKLKSAYGKARQACEGKQGDQRQECMRSQMCAQAKDPAKCQAEGKERAARREKMREACKGKQGDELRSCIREQRGKK